MDAGRQGREHPDGLKARWTWAGGRHQRLATWTSAEQPAGESVERRASGRLVSKPAGFDTASTDNTAAFGGKTAELSFDIAKLAVDWDGRSYATDPNASFDVKIDGNLVAHVDPFDFAAWEAIKMQHVTVDIMADLSNWSTRRQTTRRPTWLLWVRSRQRPHRRLGPLRGDSGQTARVDAHGRQERTNTLRRLRGSVGAKPGVHDAME